MRPTGRLVVSVAFVGALLLLASTLEFSENALEFRAAPRDGSFPDRPASSTGNAPANADTVPDLRAALTEACANANVAAEDRAWSRDQIWAQLGGIENLHQSLSNRLAESPSAENLHVAAMLEKNPARQVELLEQAVDRNPSDPFLLWGAVRICSEVVDAAECGLREWERHLLLIDGQNSESWVRVAANRYSAGKHGEALDAMRYASTAAESRAYWIESIEAIERGIAAVTDLGFPERASMAAGYAASQLPNFPAYVAMCREQSAQSVEWAYLCLAYGERVETQGRTEAQALIALHIQRVALEALGERQKVEDLKKRLRAYRSASAIARKQLEPLAESFIFSDANLFVAFLAAVRSDGELAARSQVAKEIQRLLEVQPDLACGSSAVYPR